MSFTFRTSEARPEQFAAFIEARTDLCAGVIRAAGIKPD
jgi:hypothetical protein